MLFSRLIDKLTRAKDIRRLEGKINELARDVEAIREGARNEAKWRSAVAAKLDALLRAAYVQADPALPYPFKLTASRFRLSSQNEEDGIVLALLKEIGPGGRRFVDIGCGRNGGNCGMLAYEFGWSGLMVDASRTAIEAIRQHFGFNPGVAAECARVTASTVNELIADHHLDGELDVFSLDIDSYDYWVLKALTACSPRMIITEYNWAFGSDRAVTVPEDGIPEEGAPEGYHGASLSAFTKLLDGRGYRLVACDDTGVNAFFLRADQAPNIPASSPRSCYRRKFAKTSSKPRRSPESIIAAIETAGLPLEKV